MDQKLQHVLKKAIEVAKRNDTHLDILNVLEVNHSVIPMAVPSAVTSSTNSEDVQKRLAELKKQAEDAGLSDVSVHVRFGNPKPVIAAEFPKDHHNELIMIGSTGLNALERLMVGSVATYVSRNAICDVLVVKPESK